MELELGGAQVSYVRLGETERETLITDSPTIKVDMKEQLLPKGGSLLYVTRCTLLTQYK